MKDQQHHGGLVWPIMLIAAGIILLLNNLGMLSWDIWATLWRLWPVLLIAIGLDIIIGRRSFWGSLLVGILLLAVLGAAIRFGLPQGSLGAVSAIDHTETVSEALKGAERAEVEVSFGAGTLNLTALPAGSSQLVEGELDLSQGERLVLNHAGSSSVERLLIKSENTLATALNVTPDKRKTWDLELNRDIPTSLKMNTGVGAAIVDMTQLNLTRIQIDSGVGETTMKLPQRGRYDVTINGGVGKITVIIPQGLAARIKVDAGLGNIRVDGAFTQREEEYVSKSYDMAENRADIEIDGGIGQIIVREITE